METAVIVSRCFAPHKVTLPHHSGISASNFTKSDNFFIEPMGSAAPKVATKVIDITEVSHNNTVTLLCPAQAYPVPKFR